MKLSFHRMLLLGASFFLIWLSACQEDIKTNRELLTTPEWEFSSVTGEPFAAALVESFFTGAIQEFREDGTYFITFDPNLTLEPDSGTWELATDDITLTLDKGTLFESTNTIIELSKDILTYSEEDSTGTPTTITFISK